MRVALFPILIAGCTVSRSSPAHTTDARTVMAVLGRDTALLVADSEQHVEWHSVSGGRPIVRWRSGRLYNAIPTVRLLYTTLDSVPMMWITLADEEMLSGSLYAGVGAGVQLTYQSGDDICKLPELRDVNGDGMLDIVEHMPGAVRGDQCRGDAAVQPCMDRYHLTSEAVLLQNAIGVFTRDSSHESSFYDSLASQYAKSADQLQRDLALRTTPSVSCNSAMLLAVLDLRKRARRLAGIPK